MNEKTRWCICGYHWPEKFPAMRTHDHDARMAGQSLKALTAMIDFAVEQDAAARV